MDFGIEPRHLLHLRRVIAIKKSVDLLNGALELVLYLRQLVPVDQFLQMLGHRLGKL
jgi:hypothetical protein